MAKRRHQSTQVSRRNTWSDIPILIDSASKETIEEFSKATSNKTIYGKSDLGLEESVDDSTLVRTFTSTKTETYNEALVFTKDRGRDAKGMPAEIKAVSSETGKNLTSVTFSNHLKSHEETLGLLLLTELKRTGVITQLYRDIFIAKDVRGYKFELTFRRPGGGKTRKVVRPPRKP